METGPPAAAVRSGELAYDPRTGELWRGELKLHLPSQLGALLDALLEHPGELVTREELRDRIWPAHTFLDFEHGLNAAINKLRETLGDSAHGPRYVETLPRRGYRWIAAVEPAPTPLAAATIEEAATGSAFSSDATPAGPPTTPAGPAWLSDARTPRRLRRWIVGALAAGTVIVAGFGFNVAGVRDRALRPAAGPITSIAVLPFENLGPDPGDAYLGNGIADEVITLLSKMTSLRVVSRTSSLQFKEAKKPLRQLARALGADAVVEGTVSRMGDHVRVSAQLLDGRTDTHLWAETYQRSSTELPELMVEVSRAIAERVHAEIAETSGQPLEAVPAAAYEAYLHGRFYLPPRSEDDSWRSFEYFGRAVELAPRFARAHAGLARAHALAAWYGYSRPDEAYPKARQAALAALEIDERQAEAHAALGDVRFLFEWDWTGAEAEYRRARTLEPYSESALRGQARLLAKSGRFEEAIALRKRVVELDPLDPVRATALAAAYLDARRFDDAIGVLRGQEGRSSHTPYSRHTTLATAYAGKSLCVDALRECSQGIALLGAGEDEVTLVAAGWVYATCGQPDRARAILRRYESENRRVPPDPISLAALYGALGDTTRALELVERGVNERSPVAVVLDVDLMLDSLRNHPRFERLAARVRGNRAPPLALQDRGDAVPSPTR